MYCKNCGADIPKGNRFCEECGTPVETTNVRKTNRANHENPGPRPGNTTTKRMGRKTLLAIVIAIVVLGGGIGSAAALMGHSKNVQYNEKMDTAQQYIEDGNYETAIATFDEAIAIRPAEARPYVEKAKAQSASGNNQDAIKTLKEGQKKAKKDKKTIEEELEVVEKEYEGEWKTAYRKVLEDNQGGILRYEDIAADGNLETRTPFDSCALLDINGDGTSELFFFDYTDDFEHSGLHIYTYDNGKAKELSYKVSWGDFDGKVRTDAYFSDVFAGGEECGYIVFMKENTLVIMKKFSDEEIDVCINQYRMKDPSALEETNYLNYYWSMIEEVNGEYRAKEKMDLSDATIYTKDGSNSKESFEKEYQAMCDGMTDVIYCVRRGENTDDTKIWETAESKGKRSMPYDKMIKELVVEKKEKDSGKESKAKGTKTEYQEVLDSYTGYFNDVKNGKYRMDDYPEGGTGYVHDIACYMITEWLNPEYSYDASLKYAIKDIDGNGVNELLVGMPNSYDETGLYETKYLDVFTLRNSDNDPVSILGDYQDSMYRGELRVLQNGSIEIFSTGGATNNTIDQCKITDEYKLKVVERLSMQNVDTSSTVEFKHNDKAISEDEFNQIKSDYDQKPTMKLDWKTFAQ